ncbi:Predicted nucleic acid-binding protein, contains Zn-ribbon domain [Ferrimonas sediminum]|uniref:Predicted nucleic acid-binding protein, contains Zn-ribbon domain n=1 Tax=Ferrimonas sediminum TaxID=718193 RepID=A0A1G8LQ27_9GAMM|nr:Zn-ribbon-containing protein [Ferrimonas sediminum]SDI57310.1 Predicted nucleic acid-binding protein, contains Zn-ribbon domain [Ferrimonas sediminum]
MYLVELRFECFDDTTLSQVEYAINQLVEAWRANGQILGKEFPVMQNQAEFRLRALCPEEDSLHPRFHSDWVKQRLDKLADASLTRPRLKVLGRDINSEASSPVLPSNWQLLYTTYVHTCSPLRDGETMMPVPLYRLPATFNGDHKALIKWQSEWQACDELQMAGSGAVEFAALDEITQVDSALFRRGWDLRGRIEYLTQVPTYYYLYRVGGATLAEEKVRPCPRCGNPDWYLGETIHDLFHFVCHDCRLVSNLSWDLI